MNLEDKAFFLTIIILTAISSILLVHRLNNFATRSDQQITEGYLSHETRRNAH